jgi:hypothetical protein
MFAKYELCFVVLASESGIFKKFSYWTTPFHFLTLL